MEAARKRGDRAGFEQAKAEFEEAGCRPGPHNPSDEPRSRPPGPCRRRCRRRPRPCRRLGWWTAAGRAKKGSCPRFRPPASVRPLLDPNAKAAALPAQHPLQPVDIGGSAPRAAQQTVGGVLVVRGDNRRPIPLYPGQPVPADHRAIDGPSGRYAYPRTPQIIELRLALPAGEAPADR